MNVGFVGCGSIAKYHADVISDMGHVVTAVTYRSNDDRAREFSSVYDVPFVFGDSNWERMVSEAPVDVLWVLPSWDQIDRMFLNIVDTGIPAFFEKPLALSPHKIRRLIQSYSATRLSNYAVGYNRRFYKVVREAKKRLRREEITHVYANIPESSDPYDSYRSRYRVVENSSHVIDLISHLVGSYEYENLGVSWFGGGGNKNSYVATYELDKTPVLIKSIWNSPENFSLSVHTESDRLYRLLPLERLMVFDGFEITEPTRDLPIRSYVPRPVFTSTEYSSSYKPGFKAQAQSFFRRLESGNRVSTNYFRNLVHLTQLCSDLSTGVDELSSE